MKPTAKTAHHDSHTRLWLAIAAAMIALTSAASHAAERTSKDQPAAASRRDLPPGASEAQVRRYCTRKFDEAASSISDKAGGEGGMLTGPLFAEFQACLRRNGVRP